jgi:hypothetical protein
MFCCCDCGTSARADEEEFDDEAGVYEDEDISDDELDMDFLSNNVR